MLIVTNCQTLQYLIRNLLTAKLKVRLSCQMRTHLFIVIIFLLYLLYT